MGQFDIPAALKYVQKTTKTTKKLIYIGHSMGTSMFWVAMNENQKMMDETVEMMIAMGPVAKVQHIMSPLRLLAPLTKEIQVSSFINTREKLGN